MGPPQARDVAAVGLGVTADTVEQDERRARRRPWSAGREIGKPAEIIPKLDFLAAEAFIQEKRIIDEDFLVQQGINA